MLVRVWCCEVYRASASWQLGRVPNWPWCLPYLPCTCFACARAAAAAAAAATAAVATAGGTGLPAGERVKCIQSSVLCVPCLLLTPCLGSSASAVEFLAVLRRSSTCYSCALAAACIGACSPLKEADGLQVRGVDASLQDMKALSRTFLHSKAVCCDPDFDALPCVAPADNARTALAASSQDAPAL